MQQDTTQTDFIRRLEAVLEHFCKVLVWLLLIRSLGLRNNLFSSFEFEDWTLLWIEELSRMMNHIVVSSFCLEVPVKRYYIPIIDDVCLGAAFLNVFDPKMCACTCTCTSNQLSLASTLYLAVWTDGEDDIHQRWCLHVSSAGVLQFDLNFSRNAGAGLWWYSHTSSTRRLILIMSYHHDHPITSSSSSLLIIYKKMTATLRSSLPTTCKSMTKSR